MLQHVIRHDQIKHRSAGNGIKPMVAGKGAINRGLDS